MEEAELCFPELLNTSCRRPPLPQSEEVLVYSLMFLFSLLTAVLNLLVIISISHYRQLHSPTNLIVLSLAVSDFIMGFLVMPIEILMMWTCWVLGDLMCSLYFLLPMTVISATVGNIILISIDRFVAICDPLHYPTRITERTITIAICLCWTCSLFYTVFVLYDNLKQPGRYNSCHGECVIKFVAVVDLVFAFVIPISVIIILYMRVFIVAVSQARAMRSHVAAKLQVSGTRMINKSELKAARTLGIVVAVFVLCYSPFFCVCLSGSSIMIGSAIEAFLSFLTFSNSGLNPLIYALFYPWFRKAMKHIVTLQILKPGSREANML
ncbi:trace amine-associated receptor 13c-like [Mastacembelus armatus]|uniref:trace amine-associated receptor 13c-like n=1 Tax=Mastacembelus armatus TaxID=205130 RepID=UPI000E4644EB|nr:trace amine-associated receptor 13c-like [Mastacembelus armatus]